MSNAGKTLFISDLHLDADMPAITQCFLNYIGNAAGSDALYILGDFFEVWVGDDDRNQLTDTVARALTDLAATGTKISLMHGNRDFLLGKAYAERCSAQLIEDPTVVDCYGQKLVLMHGDSLCTRDLEYMKFRKMVRSERWQHDFLERSLVERHMIAQQTRQQSKEQSSHKASDIMDVTPQEVLDVLYDKQANILIHGHTHRPSVHTIRLQEPINGQHEALRIVLGSWDSKGWALEFTKQGYDLKHFPL
jgi:UDP-2,3-diacylglucosamine hydrolase